MVPQLQMLDNFMLLASPPSSAKSSSSSTATTTTKSKTTKTIATDENDVTAVSNSGTQSNVVCSKQVEKKKDKDDNDHHKKTYTLYLIRHGEASHNVQEKIAKKKALDDAIAEGYTKDCQYTKDVMEQARKDVLNDTKLFDAPLSELGKEEARKSSNFMYNDLLVNHPDLPTPKIVLVSPLQRTLQTANIMFPNTTTTENNDEQVAAVDVSKSNKPPKCTIHVREELRERCTGKPPDRRISSEKLIQNPLYRSFSMRRLRRHSLDNKNNPHHPYQLQQQKQQKGQEQQEQEEQREHLEHQDKRQKPNKNKDTTGNDGAKQEENKSMLRERTNMLWSVLADIKPATTTAPTATNDDSDSADDNAIAIVSHKAYLREIERGPFQRPESKEFTNGEIRVYRVTINTQSKTLIESNRIV